MKSYDLAIVGGGIMGLMSAYYASENGASVVMLEKSTIGNKQAASFSYTRSMRTDYLDPFYAGLAYEARKLWLGLEKLADKELLVKCSCLNLVKKSVTPVIDQTYGARSYQVISDLGYEPKRFGSEIKDTYPQFAVDAGYLDNLGGYFDLAVITEFLIDKLAERNVKIIENVQVQNISESISNVEIKTKNQNFNAKKVIITAGMGTNNVLSMVSGNNLALPLSFDKPKECKYFYPPEDMIEQFLPGNFPVFAYLDVGIYGHPIFDRKKGAVKISYYNPTDMEVKDTSIKSVMDFVNECLPDLKDVHRENVKDADQCYYDLVEDDDFIIGNLPGFKNIIVGCGWRGTGYKFAPLIGKTMSLLAAGRMTDYNITKFNPERFAK